MGADASLRQYFAAAAAWDEDRLSAARRSARTAWRVTAAAVTVATCAAAAAALMMPLKTSVPYLIRVDSSTGVVDVVPPAVSSVTPTEAVTRHLLHMYVVAKERYVPELAATDYALVGAMQSAPLNQQWLRDWDRANPLSPLNRYRDGTSVLVQVRSITFLHAPGGAQVAQVRFSAVTRPAGGGSEHSVPWIATVAYRYGAVPAESAQRELNPLGLRVTEYQREPEQEAAPDRAESK